MKKIKTIKLPTVAFLIGILLLAVFMQSAGPRKRLIAMSSSYTQTWSSNTAQEQSPEKKQLPISTNIIEEEDKIVEDFEIKSPHHPILAEPSFSFHCQFFDEPLITVVGLPPWS